MVFTTHLFLFYFLPLVLLLYYAYPGPRYRTGLLTVLSYGFYAWSNPPWILIMFASTMLDYICGIVLYKLSGLPMEGDEYPVLPKGQQTAFPMPPGLLGGFNVASASLGGIMSLPPGDSTGEDPKGLQDGLIGTGGTGAFAVDATTLPYVITATFGALDEKTFVLEPNMSFL